MGPHTSNHGRSRLPTSDDNFNAFDAVDADTVPKQYPPRATVGAELAPGALIEIEELAVLRSPDFGGTSLLCESFEGRAVDPKPGQGSCRRSVLESCSR